MNRHIANNSLFISWALFILFRCQPSTAPVEQEAVTAESPLLNYINEPDSAFRFEELAHYSGEGYQTHILKLISQRWLTENEVDQPIWWHYLTIVVPDSLQSEKGMLWIGGGASDDEVPKAASALLTRSALQTGTVTAEIHNIPNQPLNFKDDTVKNRYEDALIAYGWRKFLENGARDEDAIWLARLPMTKAVVRAMDVVTEFVDDKYKQPVSQFLVSGASKRGWTAWTTGLADDRVFAIAPVVIDLLNLDESFRHHYRAYGDWAPAVSEYVEEGIMEWQYSTEFDRMLQITEPFSYLQQLKKPKYIINASGDEFFLPDSWKFYYNQLPGEKYLRYIPNTGHSLRRTDAIQSLIAYYQSKVQGATLPDFKWTVEQNTIFLETDPDRPPQTMKLWQATNQEKRDFRIDVLGPEWKASELEMGSSPDFQVSVPKPTEGYTAFFVELSYPGPADFPLIFTTGVVVVPDVYDHPVFESNKPKGTQPTASTE
jgi:PhoPQ-activated pathogenicity-related protein